MREILFRGKRIDNGEWVYGNLEQDIDANTAKITGYDYFVDQDGIKHRKMFCHEVKPETVGQYTGIIDKNYDRVFEHDIVEIVFQAKSYGIYYISWNCETNGWDWNFLSGNVVDVASFESAIKKIGNIHDNPELLK